MDGPRQLGSGDPPGGGSGPYAPSEEDDEQKYGSPVDPSRLLRRFKRGRWWLVGAFLLGAAIGLPLAKFALRPDFEATAMLRYEGRPPIEGLASGPADETQDVGGMIQSIYIDEVLQRVRTELDLDMPTYVVGALITADADSAQVVRITTKSKTADGAAQFANTVTSVFLDHQQTLQRQRIEEAIRTLQERISASETALAAARTQYDAFRERHGVADLTTEQEAAIEEAAELRATRDRTESELAALEARSEQLQRELRRTPRTTTQSASSGASAEETELRRLTAELTQLRGSLSDDHPRVQALQTQVATLQAAISGGGAKRVRTATTGTNTLYASLQASLSEAQADLQAGRQRLEGLTRLAREARERVEQFSSIEGEATGMLAEVRVNESLVTELQTQKARMEDALRDPRHGFAIMSEAVPPDYAQASKKKYIVAAGLPMAAVFLTLLVLMFLELKGLRVQTANETAFWGKGPVIGTSIWPRDPEAIDDLVADLDDFVPDAMGQMLIVPVKPDFSELAQQFAQRLSSDWYDTTLVGGSPFDEAMLALPSGDEMGGGPTAVMPAMPHAIMPMVAGGHHLDVQPPMQMTVEAWEGAGKGPALRRAARLADRVLVLVPAGKTSFFELKEIKTRLGRERGVGFVLVDVSPSYSGLLDRVGPVDQFWAATRE